MNQNSLLCEECGSTEAKEMGLKGNFHMYYWNNSENIRKCEWYRRIAVACQKNLFNYNRI